jgi:integral membrane protein
MMICNGGFYNKNNRLLPIPFNQLQMKTTIRNLRIIGISEGISFLVLLLIAMPLKYYVGFPLAVKYVGWIHGILFIAYILAVFFSIKAMRWGWFAVLVALGASLLPLGTFVLDRQLKRRQQEL